jgi:hypothetical protein
MDADGKDKVGVDISGEVSTDELDKKLNQLDELSNLKYLAKLDKLMELTRLSELERLENLDSLNELEKLDKLSNLKDLKNLEKLSSLEDLQKLTLLNKLTALENLKNLDDLSKLSLLSRLDELSKLETINKLEILLHEHRAYLAPLAQLESLKELSRLEELQGLGKLSHLEKIDQLKNLSQLDQLKNLNSLEELTKLKSLHHLEEIRKLDELRSLNKLEQLGNLAALDKLDNLKQLSKLDQLEKIDDAKFAERLERLDKLDVLKVESRKLVFQQVVGVGLEILKFTVAGICILVLLSSQKGQEIASKALPAIGFGNAAQTSLGLHMLVNQVSSEEFDEIISGVRKKIGFELGLIFSRDSLIPPLRRLELLRQVKGYTFADDVSDLSSEVEKQIITKNQQLEEEAVDALNFAISLANANNLKEKENFLREVKILLMNRKYIEVLKKALPKWGEGTEIVRIVMVCIIALDKEAPEVLEGIINQVK